MLEDKLLGKKDNYGKYAQTSTKLKFSGQSQHVNNVCHHKKNEIFHFWAKKEELIIIEIIDHNAKSMQRGEL